LITRRWYLIAIALAMAGSAWAQQAASPPAAGGSAAAEASPAAPGPAAASSQQVIKLTLQDCLQRALAKNLQLQKAKQQVEQARARAKAAAALEGLRVDLAASAMYMGPSQSFTVPGPSGPVSLEVSPKHMETAQIDISKPLYTSGLLEAQQRLARQGVDLSELQVASRQRELVKQVEQAFYQVQQAEDFRRVCSQAVEQALQHLAIARAHFEAGTAPRFDVLRAQVGVANARQQLTAAENAVDLAKIALKLLLAMDTTQPIEIAPPADEVQRVSLDEAQCIRLALKKRPEIALAKKAVEAAQTQVVLADAADGIKLQAMASYKRQRATAFSSDYSWNIGIGLSKPLFDGGQTSANVKAARQALAQAETDLQQASLGVAAEVSAALRKLREAFQRLQTVQETIAQAEEALHVAQVRYENAVGTSVEVTDAETALTAARSNEVVAMANYHIAIAELEAAVGISLDEIVKYAGTEE